MGGSHGEAARPERIRLSAPPHFIGEDVMRVACETCQSGKSCGASAEKHRLALVAFSHGRELPSCPFYAERRFHGIEGVPFSARDLRRMAVCA